MLDEDAVNTINDEQYHEEREMRELKNHILNMTNEERKRELWRQHFPVTHYQETDLIF